MTKKINDEVMKARAMMSEMDAKRDEGLGTPEDIIRYDNISYGTLGENPEWQLLDVYRPNSVREDVKLPVIISVHGGGWIYGDKDLYQYYCMSLAQRGFAVINFSYRLAPEYKFPCNLEDLNQVVGWMRENAQKYALDIDNVFAVGDSAGGHILSLYAAMTSNKEFADTFPFEIPKGFRFNAIATNCGAITGTYFPAEPGGDEKVAKMMGDSSWNSLMQEEYTEEKADYINTLKHMTDDFPPCFVLTATKDFLRYVQNGFVKELEEHSIPFVYRLYGTGKNPLFHVFHCNIKSPEATMANDDECAFFKAHRKDVNSVENLFNYDKEDN